ncbi:hypothetical protein V1522DRAFT_394310 [Lipomyces starkeyi]
MCTPDTGLAPAKTHFPERELLERLRKYEDLLRQNNIKFEPLHKDSAGEKESPNVEGGFDSDDEQPKIGGPDCSCPTTTAKRYNYFRGPDNNSDSSDDDVREGVFKKAWDQLFENHATVDHFHYFVMKL